MDEQLITLDAEPVSEQDAAAWAASIVCSSTVEDAVDLLLSLDSVSDLGQSLAVRNAFTLRSALKRALRRMMN